MRSLKESKRIKEELRDKLKPVNLGGDLEVIKRIKHTRDHACKGIVAAERKTEAENSNKKGYKGIIARFFINTRLPYIARHEYNKAFQAETDVDIAKALDSPSEIYTQKKAEGQIVSLSAAVYAVIGSTTSALVTGVLLGLLFGTGSSVFFTGVAAAFAVGGIIMAAFGARDGYLGGKLATADMKDRASSEARSNANDLMNEIAAERNREEITESKGKIEENTKAIAETRQIALETRTMAEASNQHISKIYSILNDGQHQGAAGFVERKEQKDSKEGGNLGVTFG